MSTQLATSQAKQIPQQMQFQEIIYHHSFLCSLRPSNHQHQSNAVGAGPFYLSVRDKKMLTAAALTCFYGFFRTRELTVATKDAYNPAIHLSNPVSISDLSLDSNSAPIVVKIHLKTLKCDQFGRGVDIYFRQSIISLCPVDAMVAYLMDRGSREGHLFILEDQSPLTKSSFSKYVKAALIAARVTAATEAAHAEIPDSTIKALGQRNSGTFLVYLRLDRQALHVAAVTHQLASASRPGV